MKKNYLFMIFIVLNIGCQFSRKNSDYYVFTPDERLFTAYAFMNAAGFDHEWRDEGMNPIRIEIREYIKSKLDSTYQKKIRDFHFSHNKGSWSGFAPYALITDGAPEFNISYDPQSTDYGLESEKKYSGLSVLLAEFYQKAEINRLFKKYKPILNEINEKYRPYAQEALEHIVKYCRVKEDFYSENNTKIHFMICPQMSYFTAQNVSVNGILYIIHGPSCSEPSPSAFYHEALHEIINPLTEKHLSEVNHFKELYPLSAEKETSYSNWQDTVNESFVRTIHVVLQGKLYNYTDKKIQEILLNEYKLGFILVPHIFEKLNKMIRYFTQKKNR